MTKPINTDAIEIVTGRPWVAWIEYIDDNDGREMPHAKLSKFIAGSLANEVDNPEWWAQSITVAYEQHIGRRIPGQLANGLFELAISKSIAKPRSVLFGEITKWFDTKSELNGQSPLKPRSTETPKRSNWRCSFLDKSTFAATVEDSGSKSKLVLSHTNVPTLHEAEEWKQYWRTVADDLTAL